MIIIDTKEPKITAGFSATSVKADAPPRLSSSPGMIRFKTSATPMI